MQKTWINGLTAVVTGYTPVPRHEYVAMLQRHGVIVQEKIDSSTLAVIYGTHPGSKLERGMARELLLLRADNVMRLMMESEVTP